MRANAPTVLGENESSVMESNDQDMRGRYNPDTEGTEGTYLMKTADKGRLEEHYSTVTCSKPTTSTDENDSTQAGKHVAEVEGENDGLSVMASEPVVEECIPGSATLSDV